MFYRIAFKFCFKSIFDVNLTEKLNKKIQHEKEKEKEKKEKEKEKEKKEKKKKKKKKKKREEKKKKKKVLKVDIGKHKSNCSFM